MNEQSKFHSVLCGDFGLHVAHVRWWLKPVILFTAWLSKAHLIELHQYFLKYIIVINHNTGKRKKCKN